MKFLAFLVGPKGRGYVIAHSIEDEYLFHGHRPLLARRRSRGFARIGITVGQDSATARGDRAQRSCAPPGLL